ncbi:MAG: hypothetical protein IKK80_10045 [Treponema sp.]|nr:hypothetical protein [Treponema sp.]
MNEIYERVDFSKKEISAITDTLLFILKKNLLKINQLNLEGLEHLMLFREKVVTMQETLKQVKL